ncbi:flagellar hook-associated protein 3 FlgL [Novosphingobium chloroacetimidivorans]|uniref:Flagellar hook-associated protein 3 FlgL n=1 Tax=Novosphingobium chloroacetimidivorans TaxID=1428314 RepID=A0A7W7K8V7_9SPHN|nr:flagellar biosynthesis protein FlgL [Novosphingobium chloroacetimidivorans]MBB4858120.1 flagellar hook-associated protein 3 FlgL [Novosphingobium chloroacetimidivorans]
MTILTTNSTSAFFDRARSDMTALRKQTEKIQSQIGSQSRLARSSDDPVAASRLRTLARSDALAKIDTTNANRATSDLTIADSTMSDITTAIARAKELATQAANGTLSADQRASIGKELAAIHGTLVGLANTRDSNGNALFGGENATMAYTLDASGNAVYAGTSSSGDLPLGDGQTVTRSMTGPEFLNFKVGGVDTDLMAVVKSLSDTLQAGGADAAAVANKTLDALSTGLDTVSTGQTVVGSRLAWIELTSDRRSNLAELRAGEEADIGGIDPASSIARLQEMLVVLQASQASFTKLSQLSLFNQLN